MAASRVAISSLTNGTILQSGTYLPAVGATVNVYQHGTTTQVTVFSAEVAGTTLPQPLTTNSNGQVPGYVVAEQNIDIVATFGGVTATAAVIVPLSATDIVALPSGTTAGDLLVASSASAVARLPIGTTGTDVRVRSDGTLYYAPLARARMSAWQADATGVVSCATAYANAVAALGANGGIVEFDTANGTYMTNTPLVVKGGLHIEGPGWGTTLIGGGSLGAGNPVLDFQRGGIIDHDGANNDMTVSGLTIDGGGVGNGTYGIRSSNWTSGSHTATRVCVLKNLCIQNCAVGIRHIFDQGLAVRDSLIQFNTTGIYASDNSQLVHYQDVQFRYNSTVGNGQAALLEASATVAGNVADILYNWKFTTCQFEGNYNKVVVLDGVSESTFDTCKWEQNGGDYITAQHVNGAFTNGKNTIINPIMNGCATGSQYNQGNNGGATYLPFYYKALTGGDNKLVWIGGLLQPDSSNQGVDFTGSAKNLALGVDFGSTNTILDPNLTLSYIQDPNSYLSMFRGLDIGAAFNVAPNLSVVAGDGGGSRNAMIGFQGRSRFGFFGSASAIQIDDNGISGRNFRVNLNNGSGNAVRFQTNGTGEVGIGGAPSVGGGAGSLLFLATATTAPTGNPTGGALLYVDPTTTFPKIRDAGGNIHTLWANGYTTVSDVAYSVLTTDYIIAYTALTAPRTVTLPATATLAGKTFIVKDQTGGAGSHTITVGPPSTKGIDGNLSGVTITTNYGFVRVYCDGSNYFTM